MRPAPSGPLRVALALVALAAFPPPAARAAALQRGQQANLILSFGAGVHTGHGLWAIPRQPLLISGSNPAQYDTARLVRTVSSGLTATLHATYFPSSHLGIHGDIAYLDTGMEDGCDQVSANFEAGNAAVCDNVDRAIASNSSFLVGGGVTLRAAPRGSASPYVRAGIAYALHSTGTIGLAGDYVSGGQPSSRQILADESPKRGSPAVLLAAGVTQSVGRGYQLRLEVRDDYFALERAAGEPANALGQVRTETAWYHHFTLAIGLDVILERRRGRRY